MNDPEHMTTEHFSFWSIDEYGDQMVSCSCGWSTPHGLPTVETAADTWGDHMYDAGFRDGKHS